MGRTRLSPFFHAIVVAGAGVSASSCGGVSNDVGQTREGDGGRGSGGASAGASQGGSAGGGASQGGSGSKGGSLPGTGGRESTGGRAATGGAVTGGQLATGGQAATGGSPADPGPATVAQWDCVGRFTSCYYRQNEHGGYGRILSENCPVNPSRPRTPADCQPGEWFACQAAWLPGLASAVFVNCECSAMGDAGCSTSAYPDSIGCETAHCEGKSLVCGCAHPVILI